ncbi:MAG: phosphotransferase [Gemmatimonadaceae bacterium]
MGSGCPAPLLPDSPGRADAADLADLIVLAPTTTECRTSGWLEEAARRSAEALAGDGVLYALVPTRGGARVAGVLRDLGLAAGAPFVHVQHGASMHYLVPLAGGAAEYAFGQLIPMRRWRRRAIMLVLGLGGPRALLAHLVRRGPMPALGFAMQRAGARPLFEWLFWTGGEARDAGVIGLARAAGTAVVRMKWRGARGTVVIHRFTGRDPLPSAVAKLPLMATAPDKPDDARHEDEAARIERFGPGASAAGARVPRAAGGSSRGSCPVALQTIVSGTPAAGLIMSGRRRALDIIERTVRWLECWNRSSARAGSLDPGRAGRELLAPATTLAPFLARGHEYVDWLATRCATSAVAPLPVVATHNDLTAANILIDGDREIGVIDWESARGDGLPLVDFYYATADAAAATRHYADRVGSVAACFAPGGTHAAAVGPLAARVQRAVGVSDDVAELCFHACWLHHAANEQREAEIAGGAGAGPFLEILRWVAGRAIGPTSAARGP